MIKKINKKGEITTQKLVILIILIVSFIIILFLLFRLELGRTTEKQACHNSVALRANPALPKRATPLNCQTDYLCITTKTCDKKGYRIEKVKTVNETYKILAQELADCWWMFGEGEVNYVGKDLIPEQLYCSFCSQIAFDDTMKKIFPKGEINKMDFYNFLEKEKISEEMTYLEYLYETENVPKLTSSYNFGGNINLEKQYYIIMAITSDVNLIAWATLGSVIAASAFIEPYAIPVIIGAVAFKERNSIVAFVKKGLSGKENFILPSLIEVGSEEHKEIGKLCKDVVTLA